MRSVRFLTFGCKANQYDSQLLREALVRRGWQEGGARGQDDLLVVNTCTVTAEAGRKARQAIRRAHRENSSLKIAVTGCLAEDEPELLREMPGVEWVLGNGDAKRPAHFLRQLGEELDPEELGIPAGITAFAGHTRAFVKIQDGCDRACSFCLIPRVRGRSKSRPIPELQAEITALLENGFTEIVLCGIHIGHWGLDANPRQGLGDLLHALASIEIRGSVNRDWRLRLSSIEATEVDGPVLAAMAAHPGRIAAHLHMPLQSGDDEVLIKMNRWYGSDEYLAACENIRAALDNPAFTADVLVGFDGEAEHNFQNTLNTVREAKLARVHVFPFSPRPGTAAAQPRDLPSKEEVRDRRARLSELAAELKNEYMLSMHGMDERVVLEGWSGLCGRYQRVRVIPEQYSGPPPAVAHVTLAAEKDADGNVQLVGHRAGGAQNPASAHVPSPIGTTAAAGRPN